MMSTIATPLSNDPKPLSRREFLYYFGGASLALLTAGTCSSVLWFALPEPVKQFPVDMRMFSSSLRYDNPPLIYVEGAQANVSLLDDGLIATDAHCTFQ